MVVREIVPGSMIFEVKGLMTKEECEAIIAQFNADSRIAPGVIHAMDDKLVVNKEVKESYDLTTWGLPEWAKFNDEFLSKIRGPVNAVRKLMPALDFGMFYEPFKLKRIDPGMVGFTWHCDNGSPATMQRQLALIFYLNDVEEGGETAFEHHGIEVKPEVGKLILFPPFWTHRHCGKPTISGPKHIVTNFLRL